MLDQGFPDERLMSESLAEFSRFRNNPDYESFSDTRLANLSAQLSITVASVVRKELPNEYIKTKVEDLAHLTLKLAQNNEQFGG